MSILSGLSGGSSLLPITNTYTTSGAIAPSDALALVNSASATAMTLAAGTTNGWRIIIKRYGAGTMTLTLNLDGTSGAIITANSTSICETISLVWSSTLSTWLAV